MKIILLSTIMMVSSLGFTYANNDLNRSNLVKSFTPKENIDKITIITKTASNQSNSVQIVRARVTVEEIENDNLGMDDASNIKEVEISSTEFADDNFVYVKERKDLVGYALQLASFSDLSSAKDFALSIAHKGDAEKRQLFIYTVSSLEKTYYKVYFGLLKSDDLARAKQRTLLSLGYSPFVREFR
ncbi:SPOR domain-containing protein [Emticicia sp. SJ17W-69]|uniref:SPOR domain-containing protein n=1 Tax=Emticicia sp. SJ17W-69 TaxID=3421657 RepID=UPI003EB97A0E